MRIDGQVRCAIGVPVSVNNICLTKTEKAADWLETQLYNKAENLAWLTSHASYTD